MQPFTKPVVVVGGSLAACAAVDVLTQRVGQPPLLVARQPGLPLELSWSMDPGLLAPESEAGRAWWSRLRTGLDPAVSGLDPAVSEINTARYLLDRGVPTLLYAAPVGVTLLDGRLDTVVFACKGGLRAVRAGWWIDATEDGELLALVAPAWRPPKPSSHTWQLIIRLSDDDRCQLDDTEFELAPDVRCRYVPSVWANERRLVVVTSRADPAAHEILPLALRHWRDRAGSDVPRAVVTHGSVIPLRCWKPGAGKPPEGLPFNVIPACASIWGDAERAESIAASRFVLGEGAANELTRHVLSPPASTPPPAGLLNGLDESLWERATRLSCEVAVAGTGTGGSVAAIVAGRRGRHVVAFDALPFPGGMGTGAGIHRYWYGVKGGFQSELDARVRELVPLFGTSKQVMGFHPIAKRLAIEAMLSEAGVTFLPQATLASVRRDKQSLSEVLLATPGGVVRLHADAWIDGTGDGDLCAMAGVGFQAGRTGDGLLHAYTQAAGVVVTDPDGSPRMVQNNADSGFVDPTDPENLTAARLTGVAQWSQPAYTATDRPTLIYPAIGIRQGRQLDCDYRLTLADLIEGRRFPDAVSISSCHFDCHHVDLEFETDEAMFWVWLCEQRDTRIGCEIPYRCLLPRGLENVWIACRALGAENDAQYSTRLQRDMQRLGEVCAIAADLALTQRVSNRRVPYEKLRKDLQQSGALTGQATEIAQDAFGPAGGPSDAQAAKHDLAADLSELRGVASPAMWRLFRFGTPRTDATLRSWLNDPSADVSWRAAAVLAMRGDPAAESRLLEAIRLREDGYLDPSRPSPRTTSRLVPRYVAAVCLLRRCGTPAAVDALLELARQDARTLNVRTAIVLTFERLVLRGQVPSTHIAQVEGVLRGLLTRPCPDVLVKPCRNPYEEPSNRTRGSGSGPRAIVDLSWQLELVVRRSLRTLHERHGKAYEDKRSEPPQATPFAPAMSEAADEPQLTGPGSSA